MSNLKLYKFSDLYEISSGISSKPVQAGHGSPFVSFKTVFNNYFLPEHLPDLMDTSDNEKSIYSIKEGDVFLTRTSETLDELGMSAVANKDYPDATYSGFLKRLRPIHPELLYHKYIAFYLRSSLFRKSMNNNAIMTLRASLNEQIFLYLNLMLPPYNDQRKAGDLLYSFNEKIELNNFIINQLEQVAKTLYEYWFVQFDFPDNQGRPYKSSGGSIIYNKQLKKEVPENWSIYTIGDIVKSINTGLNPRDHFKLGRGTNFYITIKNIEYGRMIMNSSCDRVDNEALARIQTRSKLEKGDILFTSIEPVGKTFLILEQPKNWNINESVFSLKPNKEIVSSEYLFMLLSSEEIKLKCKNMTAGSIHKGIRITPLKNIGIACPPKEIIETFTKLISPILEKINLAQQQIQHFSSLRDWLLPMIINGQVKVMDYEPIEKKK